jgi:hypothetical protein
LWAGGVGSAVIQQANEREEFVAFKPWLVTSSFRKA